MKISSTILFVVLAGGVAAAQGGDPLDPAVVVQARQQAPDAARVGNFFRGAGPKTDYQVLLQGNECYWFSGVGEGVDKLYLYLWKPNAGVFSPRVADARGRSNVTMAYCTQEAGMYRFQVKTHGPGRYVIGVFAKAAPKQVAQPAPPAPPAIDLAAICDHTAAAQGAHRQGGLFDGAGSSLGHDDRQDYTVQLDAGKCYFVVGCADPQHVKSLYLYLWGPNNKRITESRSDTATPMVGTCAPVTGMYKVQAKMNSGRGSWKVGVYAK